ncbi:hypothetical protein ABDD95_10975 [Mucilaginibacter sp. PAMB04274]|uniref:hypothetical protein n=1 Tax=Mucilaginibacter sp. PAMB04274 TaxID=3138568 RepID=UPI0031F66261
MKALLILTAIAMISLSACNGSGKLEGKWLYAGGVYNGKKEGGTEGYQLQRTYTDKKFEAVMIEDGGEPQKYQAGDYEIDGNTCTETETFSTQPSKLTNVPVHYNYQIKNDTLILEGKLPTGMQVEEHWTKMK